MFETILYCRKLFENNVSEECILTMCERIWICRDFFFENNVSKACSLTLSETIWNCRENLENKAGKWCILTSDNYIVEQIWNFREKMKIKSLKHALWWDVKRVGTAEKNEDNDDKWCIVTVFKTIWNLYVKTCGCSPLTLLAFTFYLHFNFLTFKKKM